MKTPARVITSAGNASIDGNPGYRPTRVDSNGETMGYEMRDRVPASSTPSASTAASSKGSVNAEGNAPQTGTPAQAGSSNVEPSVATPEQKPSADAFSGEPCECRRERAANGHTSTSRQLECGAKCGNARAETKCGCV
ncbi:hypothetical protein [Vibrio parahaemolyticus]|uniref:hypothetical protein n=1 Tax=Vibrio parahaemolyticus TaxID=670 RepID=UPI002A241CED|nr:hypothetical protein [Vibrio parahaemolyticus]